MNLGISEMLIIFGIALLIFGPRKLPELGRSLGRGIFEFKRASQELRHTFERGIEEPAHSETPEPEHAVQANEKSEVRS